MSQWNLGVDVLPVGNNEQRLGDAEHQFIVNGRTLGDASEKNVDTNIGITSTSTNVPTSAAVAGFINNLKGANYGLAELDENGKIATDQLPGYVDDVIEVASWSELPLTGTTSVIYVTLDTNLTYRWGGSSYVEISPSIALGTTSSTAFRGDYGDTAYSHATDSGRVSEAKSQSLYKIGITDQGHIASAEAVGITDVTTATAPSSSDTNLITGRTLYNAIASTAEIEAMFA